MVDWAEVGDGSVFDGMPEQRRRRRTRSGVDPEQVRAAYGRSIEYSLDALISFVSTYGDDDLGARRPRRPPAGHDRLRATTPSHDVPITVIARDPAVLTRIAGWGWQRGLRPGPDAPVWPMDAFRDRFLAAYGR